MVSEYPDSLLQRIEELPILPASQNQGAFGVFALFQWSGRRFANKGTNPYTTVTRSDNGLKSHELARHEASRRTQEPMKFCLIYGSSHQT